MHTRCCCCCCCSVCCYTAVLAAAVLLLPAVVRHRVPDGRMTIFLLPVLWIWSQCFLSLHWNTMYFNVPLGSAVAFTVSICLHSRKLQTCAETRQASARRDEPPLVWYVMLFSRASRGLFQVLCAQFLYIWPGRQLKKKTKNSQTRAAEFFHRAWYAKSKLVQYTYIPGICKNITGKGGCLPVAYQVLCSLYYNTIDSRE